MYLKVRISMKKFDYRILALRKQQQQQQQERLEKFRSEGEFEP